MLPGLQIKINSMFLSFPGSVIQDKSPKSLIMTPQMMHQRRDVERICLDLLKRFQHACSLHPKTQAKVSVHQ